MLTRHQNTSDLLRHIAKQSLQTKPLITRFEQCLRNEEAQVDELTENTHEDREAIYAPESQKNQHLVASQVSHLTKQISALENIKKLNLAIVEPQTAQPKHEHLFGANFAIDLNDKSTRLSMQQTATGSSGENTKDVVQQCEDLMQVEKSLQLSQQQSSILKNETSLDNLTLLSKKRGRQGKTPAAKIVWTPDEDEELRRLVDIYGDQSWHRLCKFMANKTEIRCFKRWLYLKEIDQTTPQGKRKIDPSDSPESFGMAPNIESDFRNASIAPVHTSSCTQWSKEEDLTLREKVEQYGTQNWVIIARFLPGRLGRQCRERWHNVIDPSIVRREWTKEEDEFILKMHKKIGSKWSQISKMEPLIGRTVSQIKNRFYQNLKGKDISQIKYKISKSSCKSENENKKSSRSETKQKQQRWVNQHLFEDLSQNGRKRDTSNKENEYDSSNVRMDSPLNSQPFKKRELKTVQKDHKKQIGLLQKIQKINFNEENQQSNICNLFTNQFSDLAKQQASEPSHNLSGHLRKLYQDSLLIKTQGFLSESSSSPFQLYRQKSAPFTQESVLRQQQNIQNLNNFELQKFLSQHKNKFEQILSRVSEEDHGNDQDIEVDDIGRKSISIQDQEMKDASKSSSRDKCDSGARINSIYKSNSNSEQLKTKPYVSRILNASSGLVRNMNDKLQEKVNNRHVTSEDKSKSKLDLKSIQIRQFNLEHCDDAQHTHSHAHNKRSHIEQMSVVKRVCLPKFSQNILDQFNLLDIQSSASKSQLVGYEYTTHLSSNDDDKQEGCNGVRAAAAQNNNRSQGVGSACAVQRGPSMNQQYHQMIKVDSPKNNIRCKNRLPLYPKVLRQSQSRRDHQITSSSNNKIVGNNNVQQNGSLSLTKMQTSSISKQSNSNQSSRADILLQTLLN